jgi:hypothetical protein
LKLLLPHLARPRALWSPFNNLDTNLARVAPQELWWHRPEYEVLLAAAGKARRAHAADLLAAADGWTRAAPPAVAGEHGARCAQRLRAAAAVWAQREADRVIEESVKEMLAAGELAGVDAEAAGPGGDEMQEAAALWGRLEAVAVRGTGAAAVVRATAHGGHVTVSLCRLDVLPRCSSWRGYVT